MMTAGCLPVVGVTNHASVLPSGVVIATAPALTGRAGDWSAILAMHPGIVAMVAAPAPIAANRRRSIGARARRAR